MSEAGAIRLDGVAKRFRNADRPRSVYRALVDAFRGPEDADTRLALEGVTFAVAPGEKVGVIGDNGAGKTTLLRTIAGLYLPNAGAVATTGDIALVTGLGIGMLDELSVEDNLYLYGAINGMTRDEVRERLPEIIAWAELADVRHAKLKTLSTGMRSRLAFSAVRHVEAAIYLFDEVLSAGDRHFREKCERVFEDFRRGSATFVVAAHEMEFVQGFCDKVLWLDRGRQMDYGDAAGVIERYVAFRRG